MPDIFKQYNLGRGSNRKRKSLKVRRTGGGGEGEMDQFKIANAYTRQQGTK